MAPDASGRIPPVSYSGRAGATLERLFGPQDEPSPETAHPGTWVEDLEDDAAVLATTAR